MRLDIGKSVTVRIMAKTYWNDTDLEIHTGEDYAFDAKGTWTDLVVKTDADGYSSWYMRLFNKHKRAQGYKWFALTGSLNKQKSFLIGKKTSINFNQSGMLFCYANDAKKFYFNNSGCLELTITRLM